MVNATESPGAAQEPRALAMAAVRNPANAATIAALTDLLWVMHRSRMLHQQGSPAMSLLVELARSGPTRSSDLAATVRLDQSTVSRHLAHLEAADLVTRTSDPHDGRAQLVVVTQAGRDQIREVVTARVNQLERVIDTWSDRDRNQLSRLLNRFNDEFTSSVFVDTLEDTT